MCAMIPRATIIGSPANFDLTTPYNSVEAGGAYCITAGDTRETPQKNNLVGVGIQAVTASFARTVTRGSADAVLESAATSSVPPMTFLATRTLPIISRLCESTSINEYNYCSAFCWRSFACTSTYGYRVRRAKTVGD